MGRGKVIILVIILLILGWLILDNLFLKKSKFTVPPEYKNSGERGLQYFKQTYSSDLSQARGLCTSFFKGVWEDTTKKLGCSNMEGFLEVYCAVNEANQIKDVCKEIGGDFTCSSKEISCVV